MRDELAKLLALYSDVEESCGCASLSLSTSGGKSIVKFTLETPPPPVTTTSSRSPTSPSAPGNQAAGCRRRCNRGAAWRARRNQRAAASQVTLAEVNSPPASPPPRPPRPLHHLLSPSPSTGRRRVMSLGRPEMPTFSSLNLDGSSSPSASPAPPPSTPSSTSPPPSTPSPSPPPFGVCYEGCGPYQHCDRCGKCEDLCQEHNGCNCYLEEELPLHCAVCCCLREVMYCPYDDYD